VLADQYKKPYFDSSVFISWIKMEVVGGVERGKIVAHILTLSEQGNFHVYTSTLTLAEVHKRRSHPSLSNDQDERILAFFEHDYIKLVDVDRQIGEQANGFCRQYSLYPNDAVHLACALRGGCDVLLAWDDRFVKVQHPTLRIEEPRILGQHLLEFPTEDI
jgi:predicted nucleic acid-binding protein